MAHRLLAFTSARPGNAVAAEWDEFDLDAEVPMWIIPANQNENARSRAQPQGHSVSADSRGA
jgi:hypothetical protein